MAAHSPITLSVMTLRITNPDEDRGLTRKKLHACKHCLRTISEKIVDIFEETIIFLQFLPINAHKSAFLSTINLFLLENI